MWQGHEIWLHRIRINTEEKAKLIAAVDGQNFLPPLAILPRTILKNIGWIHPCLSIIRLQFILFFKFFQCKTACEARNWTNSDRSDDLCLFFCLYPSSMFDSVGTAQARCTEVRGRWPPRGEAPSPRSPRRWPPPTSSSSRTTISSGTRCVRG